MRWSNDHIRTAHNFKGDVHYYIQTFSMLVFHIFVSSGIREFCPGVHLSGILAVSLLHEVWVDLDCKHSHFMDVVYCMDIAIR